MAMKTIRPIRIEGNVAYVPLTKGYEAVIDADDVPLVDGRRWFASVILRKDGSVYKVYAAREDVSGGRKHTVYMHRIMMPATNASLVVDHINGIGLDNRKANLRAATRSQNMMNRGANAGSRSGVKGVYWLARTGRWYAQIKAHGQRKHLGYFETRDEAAAAYRKASAELHGAFGRAI